MGKPRLLTPEKIDYRVSRKRLDFLGKFSCNVSFVGKARKTVVFVLKNTPNLFGTNCTALFDLWGVPINSFCNNVHIIPSSRTANDQLKSEMKVFFRRLF